MMKKTGLLSKNEVLNARFYLICFVFLISACFTNTTFAQVPKPIIKTSGTKLNGYFFIVPIKMRKSEAQTSTTQLILNTKGEVVYYNFVKIGSDFRLHHNGLMSYYNDSKIYLQNGSFETVDSIGLPDNIELDAHEFLILPNGNYLTFGAINTVEDYSNKRVFNNAQNTGSKKTKVRTCMIVELDKNKNVVFGWNSLNYFSLDDVDPAYLKDTAKIDIAHFNSIDVDADGNILVSARHCNQLLKINRRDSSIIWRMGGRKNAFTFKNDPIPFLGQHDARYSSKNRFTLFDNGYSIDSFCHNVRALEYEIDEQNKTANKIWSYSPKHPWVAESTGNVQLLKHKNALISYGRPLNYSSPVLLEIIDSTSSPILTLSFADSLLSYRSYFYDSLPFDIENLRPKIRLSPSTGVKHLLTEQDYSFYQWSNGDTTKHIKIDKPGIFSVCVSKNSKQFFCSVPVHISAADLRTKRKQK